MYITKVPLDIRKEKTRIAFANPNLFHGAVEHTTKEKGGKLWRIDEVKGRYNLLIITQKEPELDKLIPQFGNGTSETKPYIDFINRIKKGDVYRFRLVANPTKRINGKVYAYKYSELPLWLIKKGKSNGFHVNEDDFIVNDICWKTFDKKEGDKTHKVSLLSAAYEGVLTITDAEAFKKAMISGIGKEKAYGVGMITICRVGTAA